MSAVTIARVVDAQQLKRELEHIGEHVRAGDYVAQFGYESWELDSLDPEVLVELIRDRIDHYTDQRLLARQQDREDEERRDLDALMDRWDEVRDFLNGEAS